MADKCDSEEIRIAKKFGITQEKVSEFKEAFDIFDADHSGTITVDELRQIITSMGQKCTKEEAKKMIAEVDTDNNETIELEEFIEMMTKNKGDSQDELKQAFKTFDQNGDGKISHAELKLVMKNMGSEMDDSEIDQMIAAADINGDNEIDFEEFKAMMTSK